MATEIQLLKDEIDDLIDGLEQLNRTVLNTTDSFGEKINQASKASQKGAQTIQAFTKATEASTQAKKREIKETQNLSAAQKAAYDELKRFHQVQRDSTNYTAQLAREQFAAAKESKTLRSRLQDMAGSNLKLQTGLVAAEAAVGELSKGFKTAIDIVGNMSVAFGGVMKSMAMGQVKFTDFNGVVDAAVGSMKSLAKDIPLVGGALTAFGAAAKLGIDMLQMTSEMFENLGKQGALGAEGMDGIKRQSDAARLSMGEFTKVVLANSQSLAKFGGTTSDGAERFGNVMGGVMDTAGRDLRMLGMTREQIGEATAAFVAQQTRLGLQRTKSDAQLTQGAAAYAKTLDELSKLTGLQRDELIKQQDAALSEARFRAKYDELVEQGREEEAKRLLAFQSLVNKQFPHLAQGVRDLASDFATTDAAQDFLRLGGQSILDAIKGGAGPVEAFKQTQGLIRDQLPAARALSKAMGKDVKYIGDYVELSDAARAEIIDGDIVLKDKQKAQIESTGNVTQQMVAAREALDALQKQIETLAFSSIQPAIGVVDLFAKGLQKGVNVLKDLFGLDGSQSEIWRIVGTTAGIIIGKAIGATLGSLIGAIVGGIAGFFTGGPLGAAIGAAVGGAGGALIGGGVGAAAGGLAGYGIGSNYDLGKQAAPNEGRGRGRGRLRPGAPGAAGTAPKVGMDGLRMKSAEATAGGESDERLIGLAYAIQEQLGGDLKYFSAFNDTYERGGNSKHAKGLAMDFTLADPKYSPGSSDLVRQIIASKGLKGKVIDEYLNPSRSATGGHIHVELDALARGGITRRLSIAGEAGPEAVVPLPDGRSIPVTITNRLVPEIRNILSEEMASMATGNPAINAAVEQIGQQFQRAMENFLDRQQQQGNIGPLLQELINLQRGLNSTSERMLQVAQN